MNGMFWKVNLTFVSRLSDNCLFPFLIREPNSKCLTCLYRFNLQHQIMFHVNVVGWNAGEEIVPHNLMVCWNTVGPKKFFGRWNWSQNFVGC